MATPIAQLASSAQNALQPTRLPPPDETDAGGGGSDRLTTRAPLREPPASPAPEARDTPEVRADRPAIPRPVDAPRNDTVAVRADSNALRARALVQTSGARVAQAQQATVAVARGIGALRELETVAAQAVDRPGDPALTRAASELSARIETADRDPSLNSVRLALNEESAQQNISTAEGEAARLEEAARRAAQAVQRQPTLVLTSRVEDPKVAERRAAVAQSDVQAARQAAERTSVERALLDAGRPQLEPVLQPAVVDVSTPEAAGRTRVAVADAVQRTTTLEDQVALFEQRATQVAQSATRAATGGESNPDRPVLRSTQQAQNTARDVVQSTVNDPARALATQPFITVEAALRVLS